MSAIAVVRRLHRWIGLVTGAVIVVASLTGAVLVYGEGIQRALEPHLWELPDGSEPPLAVSAWLDVIGERHPRRRVRSLQFWSDPRRPVVAVAGPDLHVFVHPRRGEILAERDPSRTFYGIVEGIHRELLGGETGHTVVAAATTLLLIVTLLGVWLWWPRTRAKLGSSFRLELGRGWRRATYDLHNVLGFYSALVLFLLAATGVMLAYPGLTRTVARAVFTEVRDAEAPAASAGSQVGGPQTGGQGEDAEASERPIAYSAAAVDAAAAHAAAQFPAAYGTTIRFPPPAGGPLRVVKAMSTPSEPPEAHLLTYDPNTGEFLALIRHSEATAAQRANRLVGGIHLGTVYGWPTRLIAFVVSFVAGTLPITGALVWFPRWRRKRRRKRWGKRAGRRASARSAVSRHP